MEHGNHEWNKENLNGIRKPLMEQGSRSDTKDSKYSRFHMFLVCRNNKSENM